MYFTKLNDKNRLMNFEDSINALRSVSKSFKHIIFKLDNIKNNLNQKNILKSFKLVMKIIDNTQKFYHQYNNYCSKVDNLFRSNLDYIFPTIEAYNNDTFNELGMFGFPIWYSDKKLSLTKGKYIKFVVNATDLPKAMLNYESANSYYNYYFSVGTELLKQRQHWNVKKYIKKNGVKKWYWAKNLHGTFHGEHQRNMDKFQYRLLNVASVKKLIDNLTKQIKSLIPSKSVHVSISLIRRQLQSLLSEFKSCKSKLNKAHHLRHNKNALYAFCNYKTISMGAVFTINKDTINLFISHIFQPYYDEINSLVFHKRIIIKELMLSNLNKQINNKSIKAFMNNNSGKSTLALLKAI